MFARKYDARWDEVRDRLGIRREVKFKDLRATCGTALLNGWFGEPVSIETVSRILRHSDIRVTQEHYAHPLDSTVSDAMSAQTGLREVLSESIDEDGVSGNSRE